MEELENLTSTSSSTSGTDCELEPLALDVSDALADESLQPDSNHLVEERGGTERAAD